MSLLVAVNAALLAGSPALRVWYGVRPQGVNAAGIVFQIVDRIDEEHLRGDASLARARVQIDAYSTDAKEAEALCDEARALLLASMTFQTHTLSGFNDYETDTGLFRFSRDFACWFNT